MGYTETPMNAALAKQATLDPCAMPYEQQHTYAAGEMVSSRGNNYKCKNYPATSWCSVDAYAPGVTNIWEMAWTVSITSAEVATYHCFDQKSDPVYSYCSCFVSAD